MTPPPSTSPPLGSPPPSSPAPTSPPDPAAPPCCKHATNKDQPPDIKLKLGHYANTRRGIGLVFDRTTAQAKLRFDGTSAIVKVDPQPAGIDRIDFIRSLGHVALQQWGDGRVVVFVGGTDAGIEVVRDADADPL